jgi:hypothetical protein
MQSAYPRMYYCSRTWRIIGDKRTKWLLWFSLKNTFSTLSFYVRVCIYCHVFYCSVTNNNRFWIGWLHLLTPSFTVSVNHNQLKELSVNHQSNPSSLTAEDSRFHSTTDFWLTTGLLMSRGRVPMRWIFLIYLILPAALWPWDRLSL